MPNSHGTGDNNRHLKCALEQIALEGALLSSFEGVEDLFACQCHPPRVTVVMPLISASGSGASGALYYR